MFWVRIRLGGREHLGVLDTGATISIVAKKSVFASDKQHVLDLYCSKGKTCRYKFYLPSFGMAYRKPRFSELGKVLTKVAL